MIDVYTQKDIFFHMHIYTELYLLLGHALDAKLTKAWGSKSIVLPRNANQTTLEGKSSFIQLRTVAVNLYVYII